MNDIGDGNYSDEYRQAIRDFYEAMDKVYGAVEEAVNQIGEALQEAAKDIMQAHKETLEKIAEIVGTDEWFEKRSEVEYQRYRWRDAVPLDTQKAASRARAYWLRLTLEKARRIMRRRKYRKRIDERVYLIR